MFDLVVIGGGSAGVRAARQAAARGKKVAIVEGRDWGGTCVVRGCVPKKLLVYATDKGAACQKAAYYGWQNTGATPSLHWPTLRDKVQAEVQRLSGIYSNLLTQSNVTLYNGWAQFVSPNSVHVGDTVLQARHILIAVGGAPIKPRDFGFTSDDLFVLPTLPMHCTVYGGGYIGAELAGVLHGLGVAVTWAWRGDKPLRAFDTEVIDALLQAYAARGIVFKPNTAIEDLTPNDTVLWAVGRRAATKRLLLSNAGLVANSDGTLNVDDTLCAGATIYAAGDVLGRITLTPVALHEAECVVNVLYGDNTRRPDYTLVPSAVFSRPEIGTVGVTETEAQAFSHSVYTTRFKPMGLAFVPSTDADKMLMKIIVDEHDVVRGMHIVGEGAAEMIQCLGVAVKMGVTKAQLSAVMPVHPTAAEEMVTLRTPTRTHTVGAA